MKNLKAVCFGEVLHDIFPDEERIGGAPLNVASRLSSLGVQTSMISRIGDDSKGQEIISYLHANNINTSNVSRDSRYPTGVVNVFLALNGSASYEIAYPAAWDKIQLKEEQIEAVENADIFIFGTLVCRDRVSRSTLLELLQRANYRVMDFNLRAPHYTEGLLIDLLQKVDFIKFNDDELFEIAEILGSPYNSLEQNLYFIKERSSAKTVCITKGRHGAVLWRDNKLYYNSGFKVNVKDTVGAGDSFMAALLANLLREEKPQAALDYACAVGALVAGQKGANPILNPLKVREFLYPP
ncbi:carbohydrate kinase [Salegentibacter sp. F188]|jgi:fructokinase|uniref:Carbohydrate kinase n=1 Tax=Autumnicola patrickiae TaxID=3075591 RepID=A0ABU3E365_9FLAO|nr:carbohydrate kinase [Salegentibacter sp. F188]MDT0690423.1 carbohydrate kinase [Salegentibacter sp. F188]